VFSLSSISQRGCLCTESTRRWDCSGHGIIKRSSNNEGGAYFFRAVDEAALAISTNLRMQSSAHYNQIKVVRTYNDNGSVGQYFTRPNFTNITANTDNTQTYRVVYHLKVGPYIAGSSIQLTDPSVFGIIIRIHDTVSYILSSNFRTTRDFPPSRPLQGQYQG
jgi:hypothetical protein